MKINRENHVGGSHGQKLYSRQDFIRKGSIACLGLLTTTTTLTSCNSKKGETPEAEDPIYNPLKSAPKKAEIGSQTTAPSTSGEIDETIPGQEHIPSRIDPALDGRETRFQTPQSERFNP